MVGNFQYAALKLADANFIVTGKKKLNAPPLEARGIARVASGYIRQLNEAKLLIPEKNIHLQGAVGRGECIHVYFHCPILHSK